ncbi:beta strand repeat-containing protein [Siccirubricoccus deserti]
MLDTADATDIILGGDGSDTIQGKAGNDIIDGDAWLNVRISVRANSDGTGAELFSVDSMTQIQQQIFAGTINPGQLKIVREILHADGHDDLDIAVYSGNRSEYEIFDFGDFIQIAHVNPVLVGNALSNGIDTLRNIERVRFADETVTLRNLAPVGTPRSATSRRPRGMITATLGTLVDYDGLPPVSSFSYQWQVLIGGTWTNILGATAAAFTPTESVVNHQLRVQVSYVDGGGSFETVYSGPTAVVGDLFVGGNGADIPVLTAGADHAFGNGGNDTLDGGAGADTLEGGAGDDTYIVDDAGDVVVEVAGQGTDHVLASVDFTLSGSLENLTLIGLANINGTGTNGANLITGNAGANVLSGAGGNDTLIGGGGDDTMLGGMGDDVYIVDDAGDVVFEAAGQGTDLVMASVNYSIAGSGSLENLTLTGLANIDGTGNNGTNVITGNAGNNLLNGGGGHDTLFGGLGNDTLDGGTGADSMVGGAGDDTYIVDNAGDVVVEVAGQGTDHVLASVDFTLSGSLENLTLIGLANINGTGTNGANLITGNAGANMLSGAGGNDTLIGGGGDDTMLGGTGDDIYIVDDAGDVVFEATGQGTDLVMASVNYSIAGSGSLENLTLTGLANIDGTGNNGTNVITGNDGNNLLSGGGGHDTLFGGIGNDTLDGGTGADSMVGGVGDDTYIVDSAGDVMVEVTGGGVDLVMASVSHTLGIEVENLMLTGTLAVDGSGNVLANMITGNDATNRLNGGDGNDTLIGAGGNDTLIGGAGADVLSGGAGLDTFRYNFADEGGDTIVGYVGAEDRVQISVSGFGGGLALGMDLLATGRYVENADGLATNAVGQFAFDTITQTLWWDVDGTGTEDRVMIASLTGATGWSVSELQLIA